MAMPEGEYGLPLAFFDFSIDALVIVNAAIPGGRQDPD
jgi:hypothetical protein